MQMQQNSDIFKCNNCVYVTEVRWLSANVNKNKILMQ